MTEILAEVSSRGRRKGRPRDGDDIRWIELTIYWADAADAAGENDGHYVIEAVRRSDVYHSYPTECEAYEAFRITSVARDLVETDRSCYRCQPQAQDDLAPYDIVLTEVDRVEVRYAHNPDTLVTACLQMTGDGRTMTDLAKRALLTAGDNDSDIRYAYDQATDQTLEAAS